MNVPDHQSIGNNINIIADSKELQKLEIFLIVGSRLEDGMAVISPGIDMMVQLTPY